MHGCLQAHGGGGAGATIDFINNLPAEGIMASVKRKIVRNPDGGTAW